MFGPVSSARQYVKKGIEPEAKKYPLLEPLPRNV
jgi:hypothetical protein